MGAITTTTFTEPIGYPNQQYIDRENYDGDLWFAKRVSQTQVDIYKSSNNGASWSATGASFTRSNMQEISGLFMDKNGNIHIAYRVYESGADKIFYRRLPADSTTFDGEKSIASITTGSAGSVYTGMDVVAFQLSSTWYIFIAVGITNGVNAGVSLFACTLSSGGTFSAADWLISGTKVWINGPPGIVHPTLLFEHTGDAKTTAGNPSLWVVWGRSTIYAARYTWQSGPWWSAPSAPQSAVSSLSPNQPSNSATYDAHGDRCLIAFPLTSTVRIAERNVDNTSQVQRDTPTHPAGVVKHCAISVSSATSSMRIYAVGTSNNKLYYTDYTRDSDTWSAWSQVSASDIIGATYSNYSVRRVNFGNGHSDSVITTGTSPYNLISTSDTAASSPKTPVLSAPANGVAQDVAAALTFDWEFVDDDPSDSQNSYALRRTIGSSTTYWNAGSGTWDATETYNATGTTSVTLASGWGADSDASHFYAVRVRDQQGNTSGYSAQVRVIPSAKDNPTITSPTSAPTSAQITVSWTVASQTAYRIVLSKSGVVVHDTGWVTSTSTSVILPDSLLAQTYDLSVTTRNDEGLTSTPATMSFTPAYTPPQAASISVAAFNITGVVRATVLNPDPYGTESSNVLNTVYRRKVGDTGPGVKVGTILATQPVNLVAPFYKSFEETNASASWGTANATVSTAARVTSQQRTGVASFAQTAVNGTGFAGINFGPLNQFSAVPGDTFYLEFWFKANAGRNIRGQVGWRTAANAPNNVPSSGAIVVATGSWQKYTMTSSAAPSNTAFAYPTLGTCADTNAPGEQMYVDDVVYYKTGSVASTQAYDDFTVASGVEYEYSIMTSAVNGSVTQSGWVA